MVLRTQYHVKKKESRIVLGLEIVHFECLYFIPRAENGHGERALYFV